MKKILFIIMAASAFVAHPQENITSNTFTLPDSTTHKNHHKKIYSELGINTTYLIKQVFGGYSSFEIQPYQVTYKIIKNRRAIRTGIGANWSNYQSDSYVNSSTSFIAPDHHVPSYSKSYAMYGRLGWEYRFQISRKLLAYSGIDIIAQYSKNNSQNEDISNGPSYYFYERQKTQSSSTAIGIGPVLGLQFYATKRFSIFAEFPIYFTNTKQFLEQHTYSNYLNSSGVYESSFNDKFETSGRESLNITLPATIYFAVKF